jgi:hypothetical protein
VFAALSGKLSSRLVEWLRSLAFGRPANWGAGSDLTPALKFTKIRQIVAGMASGLSCARWLNSFGNTYEPGN